MVMTAEELLSHEEIFPMVRPVTIHGYSYFFDQYTEVHFFHPYGIPVTIEL
jgi:hypothetical protein